MALSLELTSPTKYHTRGSRLIKFRASHRRRHSYNVSLTNNEIAPLSAYMRRCAYGLRDVTK
jgi:hypothetical protein